MNRTVIIAMLIFSACSANTQDRGGFQKFLNSFKETSKDRLGNFGIFLNEGENMTVEQALEFVYHNDSSRLYCHFQEFNMETEERGEFTTELYLPQKCLKLTTSEYILIGYSTFECQDPSKLLKMSLTLKILDSKKGHITDSLVVYCGNEYDWQMTGLISPLSNKIFTIERLGEKEFNGEAFIYKINDALKFEIEKQQKDIKKMTDDLVKGLELLGWREAFLEE